jgi:predicted N-acetyltransferase YhbS
MSIEIRHPVPDEYAAVLDTMTGAFLERFDYERGAVAVRASWEPDRIWTAWDGGRVCGTFRSWGTELTVAGGATLPAAAVAGVAVLSTHRRRGVMTRMADLEHAALRERGEAVSVLLSAEYPIYGRFGYGVATRDATITVRANETALSGKPTGSLELAPLDRATCDAARAVFEAARRRVAGEISRRPARWDTDFGLSDPIFETDRFRGFAVLHRDADGIVDGYARYAAEPKSDVTPTGRVDVADLHVRNDTAMRTCGGSCCRSTSWAWCGRCTGRSASRCRGSSRTRGRPRSGRSATGCGSASSTSPERSRRVPTSGRPRSHSRSSTTTGGAARGAGAWRPGRTGRAVVPRTPSRT